MPPEYRSGMIAGHAPGEAFRGSDRRTRVAFRRTSYKRSKVSLCTAGPPSWWRLKHPVPRAVRESINYQVFHRATRAAAARVPMFPVAPAMAIRIALLLQSLDCLPVPVVPRARRP